MQYILDVDGQKRRLQWAEEQLSRYFVRFPPRYIILPPISQLVMSLLGGQTYGHVSRAAHQNLLQNFKSWSEVRDAPYNQLHRLIRGVTRSKEKAEHIQSILSDISDRDGRPTLDHLKDLSAEDAHRWLESIKWVGPKIAAAVVNTSQLRKRSLVIDTHHRRVMQRFGLIPYGSDFVRSYRLLMPLVPENWTAEQIDEHHMRIKRLGQTLCRPRHVYCDLCPLSADCPTGQAISLGKPVYLGPEASMERVNA
ncbi:MAG: endonuclease III [Pseudomonadota bacterium]